MLKLIKTLILLFPIVFTIGCNQVIPNDEPQTITDDENPMPLQVPNEDSSSSSIRGFKNITKGMISDISSDGNQVLLLRQDSNNIESSSEEEINLHLSIYDREESQLNTAILTQPNIFHGRFDENEEGFYFLENMDDSNVNLYWTTDSVDKKVSISSSNDNMNPNFYTSPDNNIYYGTKEGFVVITNKEEERATIDIGSSFNIYDIRQVYHSIDNDYILFSANKDDSLSIYILNLEDNTLNLLIPNTVGSFSVDQNEEKLLYITTRTDSNIRELGLLSLDNLKTNIIVEGFIRRATFSPNGDKIAYLESLDANTDLRNIWVYNIDNQSTKQVASNLRTIGNIFWNPQVENQLLFSTYETQENDLQATIHSLDFE